MCLFTGFVCSWRSIDRASPVDYLMITVHHRKGLIGVARWQTQHNAIYPFCGKFSHLLLRFRLGEQRDINVADVTPAFFSFNGELCQAFIKLRHMHRVPALGILRNALHGPG